MKTSSAVRLAGAAIIAAALPATAAPKGKQDARDVDTRFPYEGPAVPVGDWVDPTVNGNGKGFPRLIEVPAVTPKSSKPTNNINVIQLSYVPNGINIRYQTPFGLGEAPSVHWGTSQSQLNKVATGKSAT